MESYSLRNMYLSVLVVDFLYFNIGATLVWTSPMLPYLTSVVPISTLQEAIITSSCFFGAVFGPYVGKHLIERYGHKSVMWLYVGLSSASLLLLAIFIISPSIFSVCVGRLLAGIAIGAVLCHMPGYVADIAEPEVLAVMRPVTQPVLTIGYLLVYCLGTLVSYRHLLVIYIPLLVLTVACLPWLPPSPLHCVAHGNIDLAKDAIACLKRGISTTAVDLQVQHLQLQVERQQGSSQDWQGLITVPAHTAALLLTLPLVSLVALTGAPLVVTVVQPILLKAHAPSASVMVIGLAVFLISTAECLITSLFGIKKLLVSSSLVMALSLLIFGLYLANLENHTDVSGMIWVPPLCILLYLSAFQVGVTSSLDVVVDALYSQKFKVVGSTLSSTVGFSTSFIVALAFFPIAELWGASTVILIFALFCVLVSIFIGLCIPNISIKSPSEIEEFLTNGSWFSVNSCKVSCMR